MTKLYILFDIIKLLSSVFINSIVVMFYCLRLILTLKHIIMKVSFYNNGIYADNQVMNSNDLYNLIDKITDKGLLHICNVEYDNTDYGSFTYAEYRNINDLHIGCGYNVEPVMFVVLVEDDKDCVYRYLVDYNTLLNGVVSVMKYTDNDPFGSTVNYRITDLLSPLNLCSKFQSQLEYDLCM